MWPAIWWQLFRPASPSMPSTRFCGGEGSGGRSVPPGARPAPPPDAVNEVLRRERQWLPLDPPRSHRATIGGIVATNDSGPRRHRFGAPRDLIIGIEIALADGRIAKA